MEKSRRAFLGAAVAGLAGAASAGTAQAAQPSEARFVQVWSCGGLAEAMVPAHVRFTEKTGIKVVYTGAFAGALGKSLLTGSGSTEVFCGRVLQLAKNLRKAGKMLQFRPLCFTNYGIAVPKGNPKGIKGLEDLAPKGFRLAMAPLASPPGSAAVMAILKLSGMTEKLMPNVLDKRASCIQSTVKEVCDGRADAMIVERRICRIERFAPYLDYIPLPAGLQPPGPLTFTVGVMAGAHDPEAARTYQDWITSPEGQAFFEKAGFISAYTEEGQALVKKLEVYDA